MTNQDPGFFARHSSKDKLQATRMIVDPDDVVECAQAAAHNTGQLRSDLEQLGINVDDGDFRTFAAPTAEAVRLRTRCRAFISTVWTRRGVKAPIVVVKGGKADEQAE